ncbi:MULTISPECIES: XrtA-associated tyrosine autokinase [unclassified Thioalkalivibrio]|uniref:XrtA-associated tyrosine autokinase n=1 Tax=unclassified Thioalkalivibrio TaxID=2621013 RepID=UPI000364AD35|nr:MULTISPECIES: XrtA-associated tyrosine autokinase [unclassified Thioalkalivibrio]
MSIIEKALDKSRSAPIHPLPADAASGHTDREAGSPETPASEHGAHPAAARIDFGHLRRQGLIVPGDQRSTLAEEIRMMKRPLLNNAFGRHSAMRIPRGRLIMVTSSLPREGKTFLATNLAISMAMEVDRTVLLVDADVAQPTIPKVLGFKAERGLMDVLTEPDLGIPDVLMRTNIENLSVLPAGRPHGRSTEILASDGMRALLDELHDRYQDRIILFDSPPLLATSEPGVLAAGMGQVVMVVDAERTPAASVENAMQQLAGCDVVLTALNRAPSTPGLGYGTGYYHERPYGEVSHEH